MVCYLIRHGKDDDTVRGGWSASPLTDEGIAQVKVLASNILNAGKMQIEAIYTSDLPRARQTADILSAALHITVTEKPEFRETNNGILAGMDNHLAAERYPGLFWSTLDWDQCYPGGESPCQFFNRIKDAWRSFKKETQSADYNVILVTHGGVINVIRCIENGIQYTNKEHLFPTSNAEMVAIDI